MKSSINILSIILNVFLIFAVIVLLFDRDDEEEIIKFRDNEYIVNVKFAPSLLKSAQGSIKPIAGKNVNTSLAILSFVPQIE